MVFFFVLETKGFCKKNFIQWPFYHLLYEHYCSAMWCKRLTVKTIMAEEFDGTGFWNVRDGKGGSLGMAQGLQTEGEGTGNGWKGGKKTDLRLKSQGVGT